eukprot:SAG11_NODE_1548_length_4703_cov_6.701564_2_plen_101_part_00
MPEDCVEARLIDQHNVARVADELGCWQLVTAQPKRQGGMLCACSVQPSAVGMLERRVQPLGLRQVASAQHPQCSAVLSPTDRRQEMWALSRRPPPLAPSS